jgi:hypothetical protein
MRALSGIGRGAAAGAAGTTALNAVTYLDMAVRGRPASSTPEQTVEELSDRSGLPIPGDRDERKNRVGGLGPLSGLVAGVGTGVVVGVLRALGVRLPPALTAVGAGAAAMLAGNGPMTALGVSDPRTWSPSDWVADAVPHLAYGLVTALVLEELESR